MNDKLLIATNIKKTIEYVDKTVSNYPKGEIVLKTKIQGMMYDMLENVYMASIDLDGRVNYIKKVITDVKMVDFFLKLSFDKGLISFKRYNSICNYLIDINKLLMVWLNNEKSR